MSEIPEYYFCVLCNREYVTGLYSGSCPHERIPAFEMSAASIYSTKKPVGRVFEGGAYRDFDEEKLDFAKALCPHVLETYVAYLGKNRLQSNGEVRQWDNWKSGIPQDVYMSSMYRHMHAVWKGTDNTDDLCALMFNVMGMLHEKLKECNDVAD